METVVIVTGALGRPSVAARAARAAGFHVALRDARAPLDEVAVEGPDIVILDLPTGASLGEAAAAVTSPPGMEDLPVLALVDEADLRQLGPGSRVADFCLLPLREPELAARIRRLVRAVGQGSDDRVAVEDLVIDLRGYTAAVAGAALDFTYQEFELLKFLATHPGQAYSRDQLLARVWGYDYFGGARTVDIHVRRVRAKLGPHYATCLRTIRHVGYKWVASTDPEADGGDP